jgi:hypothetical protein
MDSSIINNKKKPISKTSLIKSEPWLIIMYFNSVAHGLLSYYRCVDNFNTIKKIVTYHVRYSLLCTLAHKHKSNCKEILSNYGKKITASGRKNKGISFIDSVEVSNMKKDFLISNIKNPYEALSKSFINFQKAAISAHECAIKGCNETENIEVHHIRQLHRSKDKNNRIIVNGKSKKLSGTHAIASALKRKQIPLCRKHYVDWHKGNFFKSN